MEIAKGKSLTWIIALMFITCLVACEINVEDPGPLQFGEKEFIVSNFTGLEVEDGIDVQVVQGNTYSVRAEGDLRNIHDLRVRKDGKNLSIEYNSHRSRRHDTRVFITMPVLLEIDLEGAADATIRGFESDDDLDVELSGASTLRLESSYPWVRVEMSGASEFVMAGEGHTLKAEISGASKLYAFDFTLLEADLRISGASKARVDVDSRLKVKASGASDVRYRGTPSIDSDISGGSTLKAD
jgi:hypothetical protein